MTDSLKRCTKCGVDQDRDAFYNNQGSKDGKESCCKKCRKEYQKLHPSNPQSRRRDGRNFRFREALAKLGITSEDYEASLIAQEGRCAICRELPGGDNWSTRLHLDHDHTSGRVRGLLCMKCNMGIGLGLDDPEILRSASRYLLRTPQKRITVDFARPLWQGEGVNDRITKEDVDMTSSVESMFSGRRQIPWHKLGTVVEDVLTAAEAIKAAELDWAVRKIPMFVPAVDAPDDDDEEVFIKVGGKYVAAEGYHKVDLVPDKYGIQRVSDGSVLGGWMGTEYTEFQNVEAFDLFDAVVGDGEAKYETAGSLFGGRQIFILASLNRNITIAGDKTVPYLLLTTSHDGSGALRMLTTPVRVVCANTLRLALTDHKSDWSTRHTTGIKNRVAEARTALQIGWEYYDAFQAEVDALMNQAVTPGQTDRLLAKVFPRKDSDALHEKALAVRGLYESSPTIGEFRGTAWGLLNGVNEWEQWSAGVRDESKRIERQAKEILSGIAMPATKKIHDLLIKER